MRKLLPLLATLLLPLPLLAQGTLKVSSVSGAVGWRAASSRNYVQLTSSAQTVGIGDEVTTGPGSSVILEVPDGSYMVVSENSRLIVDDFWSPNLRSLINLIVGKVRFNIQRLGGRPNPYRVTTPTALIAVRGTVFEVSVDEAQIAEVRCFEGRVAVESAGLSDREVILDPGRKTLVRPGEYPLAPVSNDEAILRNRVIRVVKRNVPDGHVKDVPSMEVLTRDNDRRNRTSDPVQGSNSRTNDTTTRAKPTLNFPN